MEPFVRLQMGWGLFDVTKLRWRTWPSRSALSWVAGAVFLAGAGSLAWATARIPQPDDPWQRPLAWAGLGALVLLVVVRLVLEGTVSRTPPGHVPAGDRKLLDPWWSTIHTLAGVTLGLWLVPLLVVVLITLLWEALEISVPGFGDEEINGNRMFDLLLAWLGWGLAAALVSALAGTGLPLA